MLLLAESRWAVEAIPDPFILALCRMRLSCSHPLRYLLLAILDKLGDLIVGMVRTNASLYTSEARVFMRNSVLSNLVFRCTIAAKYLPLYGRHPEMDTSSARGCDMRKYSRLTRFGRVCERNGVPFEPCIV